MVYGRLRSSVLQSKFVQFLLCLFAVFLVYVYYNGGSTSSFSNEDNKIFHSELFEQRVSDIEKGQKNEEDSQNLGEVQYARDKENNKVKTSANVKNEGEDDEKNNKNDMIEVMITFTNAVNNPGLQQKFRLAVSSLLKHATVPMTIHVIGDLGSQNLASKILKEYTTSKTVEYKFAQLDVDRLAKQLEEVVKPMQQHFSFKAGSYYSHALFFLSIAMHRALPDTMKRVIMLDADIKFLADIKELYSFFDQFKESTIIGVGNELQPVYRHTFWQYRSSNPGTRVGEPPPHGLTGFNSGVLLLDLEKMRKSTLYNSLLNAEPLKKLTEKYEFKGHLGDQDFFTLLGMEHEELFYTLPCNWNRQLCIWWKDKGYADVFDSYHKCDGPVKIYHGNCNTPIPNSNI